VVQEDTKEVVLVVPVDLKVEQVGILHLSVPIHHLGGFLDLYIRSSRGGQHLEMPGQIGG